MRVGINATCFNERSSGAKQRFIGIYSALFKLRPDIVFIIYEPSDCRVSKWFPRQANIQSRQTPIPSTGRFYKLLTSWYYWRFAFKHEKLDIFEASHLPLISPSRITTLLTIHDIRGIYPGNSVVKRLLSASVLRKGLSKADHVITVSSAMRDEIHRINPTPNVLVLYNGIDISLYENLDPQVCFSVVRSLNLPNKFLFAIGHFEKRKNYSGLINALAQLKRDGRLLSLVIAGNDNGGLAALEDEISHLGLMDQVHLLHGLSDYEVRCVYRCCSLVVFPSFYEGFGIPILEAMAAQRPMVLSDLPVFREITENQAVYFNPRDPASISTAITSLLESINTQALMVAYGKKRVKDFDFSYLANNLANVYGQCKDHLATSN